MQSVWCGEIYWARFLPTKGCCYIELFYFIPSIRSSAYTFAGFGTLSWCLTFLTVWCIVLPFTGAHICLTSCLWGTDACCHLHSLRPVTSCCSPLQSSESVHHVCHLGLSIIAYVCLPSLRLHVTHLEPFHPSITYVTEKRPDHASLHYIIVKAIR